MKRKMNKNVIPEDFTLSLALVDAIPVVFFGLSMIVVGVIFDSLLLMIGAFLCLLAGLAKVIWKIIVATKRKNIWFLFIQMRTIMPVGLLLMIIAGIINRNNIDFMIIINKAFSMPSSFFFIVGIICMCLMIVFAFVLDNSKVKNNWLEQIVNAIAQICFFIGLLQLI